MLLLSLVTSKSSSDNAQSQPQPWTNRGPPTRNIHDDPCILYELALFVANPTSMHT